MKYYLGIDGGGTKTKAIIINDKNDVIFENISGPSSIDTVDNETTLKHIKEAIEPYVSKHPKLVFSGAFIGLGGIVFEEDCRLVEDLVSQLPQVNENTFITAKNDMYNALFSSNNFDQGMALICGTGMVAFGINKHQAHKAGGWGYYEGELGSAYHLGREAIRACIRAYDNRYKKSKFSQAIAQAIGLEKATDIIQVSSDFHDQRTKTASLAPIVTKYANLGDPKAKAICDKAIFELVLAIKAVYETLKFEDVNLVIIGSLGHAKGYFHETLLKSIYEFSSKINVIDPVLDPALGAAKAAKIYSEEI